MKIHILPAIIMTLVLLVVLTVVYPAALWAFAQLAHNNGKGEIIEANGTKYYANIGQSFTDDKYFWSRPSAVDYNAAGSGASNKGASNQEYLALVQARIDTFLVHNPATSKAQVPVELVTASGSGLDPNLSVAAARVQVKRIANVRQLDEASLNRLIDQHIEKPLLGLMGPEKINVLKLNIALDTIK